MKTSGLIRYWDNVYQCNQYSMKSKRGLLKVSQTCPGPVKPYNVEILLSIFFNIYSETTSTRDKSEQKEIPSLLLSIFSIMFLVEKFRNSCFPTKHNIYITCAKIAYIRFLDNMCIFLACKHLISHY